MAPAPAPIFALPEVPATHKYERVISQPENPFFPLIQGQQVAIIPSFTLESGVTLYEVPVAYKTWGRLNHAADNVMVICHALTGSADVSDWWGPLVGPGRAFDPRRYFIVCCNTFGSPYGTASPVTREAASGTYYGPEFPVATIRDDVNIHKLVLDDLGVKQIAVAIGGSMGGMQVLEWAYFGANYVRTIVPIATSSRHSAWCISWAEAQRQSISVDPKYEDGYYPFDDPPAAGLGAARMSALLTYRSRNSFESRFGRNIPDPSRHPHINSADRRLPCTPAEQHWAVHTDGFPLSKKLASPRASSPESEDGKKEQLPDAPAVNAPPTPPRTRRGSEDRASTFFSAQTYLRYQANKFVKRFDANCYISITRKLDTHDVSRGRGLDVKAALQLIKQPTLVIGIESDGLFTYAEQQELAECIPNAQLATINSPEGHDAFLLEFEEVNTYILGFLEKRLPEIYERDVEEVEDKGIINSDVKAGTVGEVDDITAW